MPTVTSQGQLPSTKARICGRERARAVCALLTVVAFSVSEFDHPSSFCFYCGSAEFTVQLAGSIERAHLLQGSIGTFRMNTALAKELQDIFASECKPSSNTSLRYVDICSCEACLKKQLQESSEQLQVRLLLLLSVGFP
uniref:Uncharacterized protein n=1 Tax=Hyaloperonospora arabidopsidis (strain Emoy2) TaxID=559515 RepID=M4BMV5_HYAAE